ncbi:MAG: HD domain-containing protein [Candidatus Babeliales bacterium]
MVNQDLIITKTAEFVKNKMDSESTGHDWLHVYRVWNNSIKIGHAEQVDMFVVQLGALLHDIADWKFYDGDLTAGARITREFLDKFQIEGEVLDHVCEIVKKVSFKGAKTAVEKLSKEGQVVQDADRLDAIGAIGIARAFAYGGYKQREIYNPAIKPIIHESFEHYKNSTGTSINHFHEKLLFLKDMMNTQTAKKMACERHAFMEEYLRRFYEEVEVNESLFQK